MIKYKDLRERQKRDIKLRLIGINIYRNISTPFTWIFVNLGIAPNTLTLLGFIVPLFGYYYLSQGSYFSMFIGTLWFLLFKILDVCDGEVARFTNSKSLEGLYFDRINHYVFSLAFGVGIGLGLSRIFSDSVYLHLGFLFALIFILENAISDMLKTLVGEDTLNKILSKAYNNKTWEKGNIIQKLFNICPYQGLLFTDTLTVPILVLLSGFEFLLNELFSYTMVFIPLYLLVVIVAKLVWIVWFIYSIEKNRYISTSLRHKKVG